MATTTIVKLERPETPPAVPALTPVSVKSEIPEEARAESSTSRRRSARHIPLPPSPEADEKPIIEEGVFVVGGIVAKSLVKGMGPWGLEHQYLIRWDGYEPKDDTWEWSSNVAQDASDLLDQFDKMEHPFNVIGSTLHKNATRYLFEVCAAETSTSGLWSPLAEKRWMSILDFRMKKRISDGSIKAATEGCKPVAFAQPPSVVPGEKRKHVSDDEEEEVGEEEEEEDERNAVRDGRYYTHRKLLAILDDHRFRKGQGPWYTRYKVRHRLKFRNREYRIKEEWYTNSYMLRIFGPVAVCEKLKVYMPEQDPIPRADGIVVPIAEVSDYEKERLRRMKENDELMKQLGLAL